MKIVDLSIPVDSNTQVPPSQEREIEIETVHKEPGFWQASWLSISAHLASHVDSPLHVIDGKPKIGEIPLEKVIGEAVVLNLTDKGENDAIIEEDLQKFADDINEDDIVILRTDWGAERFTAKDYSYWNKSPYVTPDAAKWLVKQKPKAIAFDFFEEYSARLDDFEPDDFEMHKIILGEDIIIIEGLTNLDKLPKKVDKFFACPLKIVETEAAPARIYAILED